MNFPKTTLILRRQGIIHPHDSLEAKRISRFETTVSLQAKGLFLPNVIVGNTSIYPISQKHSQYINMPYGKIGTIGEAGCGPLAAEYALRSMGFNISFEEIVRECVDKNYRAYIYDNNGNIIDGSGTEYSLFDNLANELKSLYEILEALEEGKIVTLLINNAIYHQDENRKGNHFITLVGIDKEGNALLMDGNLIEDEKNPEKAFVKKDFRKLMYGIRLAWSWSKEKVEPYTL